MEKTEIVMDYKKKYDEALERARKLKEMYPQDAPGYEEVFPELRESEDERIRKEIIKFIQDFCNPCDPDCDKWIAYLEKQKENPKSADSIPSDCVSDAKCEDRSPKHSDSDGTDIRDTPAYWKGWDDAMKQKEQKHPNGCFTCDEYKKGYEEGRRNGFTAGYNKAMKEVEQKEQKPWKVGANAYFTPEQKPVEWSEEDEKMLNNTLDSLKRYQLSMPNFQVELQMRWLKSLRPSWKPSKEDLMMLEHIIEQYEIGNKNNKVRGYLPRVEELDFLKKVLAKWKN